MTSPPSPTPNEKKLRVGSFAVHAARGLVRDQRTRRKAMFVLTLVALLLLFGGATFLAPVLDPRARPGWFMIYWLVCAWVTFTVVLLAVFDLLLVRAQGRKAQRGLGGKLAEREPNDDA
ncbi:MAG: hypothetical protein ACREF8_00895 [Chthoniobacterales bacterium]